MCYHYYCYVWIGHNFFHLFKPSGAIRRTCITSAGLYRRRRKKTVFICYIAVLATAHTKRQYKAAPSFGGSWIKSGLDTTMPWKYSAFKSPGHIHHIWLVWGEIYYFLSTLLQMFFKGNTTTTTHYPHLEPLWRKSIDNFNFQLSGGESMWKRPSSFILPHGLSLTPTSFWKPSILSSHQICLIM